MSDDRKNVVWEEKMMTRISAIVMAVLLLVLVLFMLTCDAMAYRVDGDLGDWGLNLSGDWNRVETWMPASATADWIVEDNIDCESHPKARPRGYCGIHIKGSGTSYSNYTEPKITWYGKTWYGVKKAFKNEQPSGRRRNDARTREVNDIEAMYFDTNETHVFFAFVTSIPPDDDKMGDLAIDLDNDKDTGSYGGYEYGIGLQGMYRGMVCRNPEWSGTIDFPYNIIPYRMVNGTITGRAAVKYVILNISDYECPNWAIEIGVPREAFGNPSAEQVSNLHITLSCGNDIIEIGEVSWDYEIPEFSNIAVPLIISILLYYYYHRRKEEKELS